MGHSHSHSHRAQIQAPHSNARSESTLVEAWLISFPISIRDQEELNPTQLYSHHVLHSLLGLDVNIDTVLFHDPRAEPFPPLRPFL